MSTSETRANDPFSVALAPEDIHTCAFPDGNFGYGVLVERTKDGRWRLTPAPEPEERKQRRQERNEKIAARRAKRKKTTDIILGSARNLGMRVVEIPIPEDATEVTLDEVVLSRHAEVGRWKVAGHWNLAGAWRAQGTDDWPFGGNRRSIPWSRDHVWPLPNVPLVACLPDGTTFVPRIPTFAEAEAWILAQKLRAPPWECGCGQVHAEGGEVVGLLVEEHDYAGRVMRTVRLIAREDGHQRYRECLPEEVLDLRMCTLLDHVEVGGHKPSWWNRNHGDEAARAREDQFDRMKAEADARNAETLRRLRGQRKGEA